MEHALLKHLDSLILPSDKTVDVALGPIPQRLERPVRIVSDGKPIQLELGRQTLRLYREFGVDPAGDPGHKDWILVDPSRFFSGVAGFIRLRPGEAIFIGRNNETQDQIFDLPKSVAKRHMALRNDDGTICAAPLDGEASTYISCVADSAECHHLPDLRRNSLLQLCRIFGGPIELLPESEACETLERVIEIFRDEACRPKDSHGQPGGILELPGKQTPIIIGDVHAQIDNLLTVLSSGGTLEALKLGDACLLILGDAVHRESEAELSEMDTSLLVLDLIFKLKIHFPRNVFYLRGNHESFDEEVSKGGVLQGQLLQSRARKLRGKKYARQLAECFDLLPYVALSDDFIACHAGPPRMKVARQKLIDIRDHPKLARELLWNRLQTPSRLNGYTKKDVKALRAKLDADKRTPVIVSHTRLSQTDTVWIDAGRIKNHHIVCTGNTDELAVFIRAHQAMVPLKYSVEPLLNHVNRLDWPLVPSPSAIAEDDGREEKWSGSEVKRP
jgi:hypothetical protein